MPSAAAMASGAFRQHYLTVLGWAFTLFNSVRVAAYLPTGAAPCLEAAERQRHVDQFGITAGKAGDHLAALADAAREADNDRIHQQEPKAGTIVTPGATAFFQTYRFKRPLVPNRPNVTPGRR